jgi:hypothetical protein
MAGRNAHLRGDTKEVMVPIHGNVLIIQGEDIYQGVDTEGITGSPTDRYGYPASKLANVTAHYSERNYIGIAMQGKITGVTKDIAVATAGIFRRQLDNSQSRVLGGVTVGFWVAGSTLSTSGASTMSGTSVICAAAPTYARIGKCIRAEGSGASFVDFILLSRFSGVSIGHL